MSKRTQFKLVSIEIEGDDPKEIGGMLTDALDTVREAVAEGRNVDRETTGNGRVHVVVQHTEGIE